MNLTLTEEQRALADMARALARATSGPALARDLLESRDPPDRAGWRRLAEAGLAGLLVAEEADGGGAGPVEAAVVAEALGAALSPHPFVASAVWAATVLRDAEAELRRSLAAGDVVAAVVLAHDAEVSGGRLRAHVSFVPAAAEADVLVVVAGNGPDSTIGLIGATAEGVTITPLRTLDATQPLAEVALDDVMVDVVARGEAAGRAAADGLALARLALAAEQVGVAQAALDMAVAYAKVREQFGRPIGSFQAIKHKCADMVSAVESARSLVLMAAHELVAAGREAPLLVAAASVHATDAAVRCAEDNIQIHGGIGFTWEHDAHLFMRRARASRPLLGDPDHHLDVVAAETGMLEGLHDDAAVTAGATR